MVAPPLLIVYVLVSAELKIAFPPSLNTFSFVQLPLRLVLYFQSLSCIPGPSILNASCLFPRVTFVAIVAKQ